MTRNEIELYTWTTPNGIKPLIMLEELALPYRVTAVDIGRGEQFAEEFVRINPNSKIPAMVDGGVRVFESGAILMHLAERTKKFLPTDGQARADVLGWLFFQVGSIGPMFGQLGHFRHAKREDPYPLERYEKEVERLTRVVERQLERTQFLAGDYSIADIASFGWIRSLREFYHVDMTPYPNVARWIDEISARPAVMRALAWKP